MQLDTSGPAACRRAPIGTNQEILSFELGKLDRPKRSSRVLDTTPPAARRTPRRRDAATTGDGPRHPQCPAEGSPAAMHSSDVDSARRAAQATDSGQHHETPAPTLPPSGAARIQDGRGGQEPVQVGGTHRRARTSWETQTNAQRLTSLSPQPFSWKAGLLFVLTGAGLLWYFENEKQRMKRKRVAESSKGVGRPKVGGPFALVDQDGNTVTDKDLKGRYSLVSARGIGPGGGAI